MCSIHSLLGMFFFNIPQLVMADVGSYKKMMTVKNECILFVDPSQTDGKTLPPTTASSQGSFFMLLKFAYRVPKVHIFIVFA